ncbi:MAG: hypothetical protein KDB23_23235, partial [Planctomycetales bacterium]|nr:hypothetical protein [Planctomycetales bacterium]
MDASATSAQELLEVKLQLRRDLRCTLQSTTNKPYYQIEDPLSSHFYRIGCREWSVISRLDGRTSLLQAIWAAADGCVENAMAPLDAVSLARWLLQSRLAVVTDAWCHPYYATPPSGRKPSVWLNPAFIKIPLFNPDPLLVRCLPWLRWLLTPGAFIVWVCVVIGSLLTALTHWDDVTRPLATILAPDNWLYLLIVWVGLKGVHELFHGLVCKKYGGRVPSCGLMLILFSPVAFVDVTSSWKFRSKWQRIYTAAAGMYVELFIAAVATQVW